MAAIQRPDHPSYDDVARLAIQQLDLVIGRLQADLEERAVTRAHVDLYQLTSPVYWLGRLPAFVKWVVGTYGGRVVGIVIALLLAIMGGIASGAAQAFVERLMAGP